MSACTGFRLSEFGDAGYLVSPNLEGLGRYQFRTKDDALWFIAAAEGRLVRMQEVLDSIDSLASEFV
jgi:predicted transcriptional regulator